METIFISRVNDVKDKKDKDGLEELVKKVCSCGIKERYILSKAKNDYKYKIDSIDVQIIADDFPTSPVSINKVLDRVKDNEKLDLFLVISKEVEANDKEIKALIELMEKNKDTLLVAGYKFEIKDDNQLENELEAYYHNKNLIAYQVPWNTCAIWNYELFKKYVGKFDEITNTNPFNKVSVCIDGVCSQTDHKGMEDGLAIAKAVSQKQEKIYYKLLGNKKILWEINLARKREHREKLARKDIVMRNFIGVRDYSVDDLRNSKLEKE